MTQPDVSVLLPIYTITSYGEAMVKRAIDSALSQAGVVVEVVAIDDCSPDDSRRILLAWARGNQRLQAGRNTINRGTGETCNRAAAVASGRYLIQGSCRAWWEPGAFKALVDTLDTHPATGFCYGATQFHGAASHLHQPPPFQPRDFLTGFPATQFFLYRREAVDVGCRYENMGLVMDGVRVWPADHDFINQLIFKLGWRGFALDTLVAHYYRSAGGQQSDVYERHLPELMRLFRTRWP